MAYSVKLTDGTTSYELVYDASTQTDYKLQYGMSIGVPEPNTLWHQPDDAPRIPIRSHDTLRQAVLTTTVYGTDWDDVINNLTKLKRMVDGAGSQAQRYHLKGDVDKVYLQVALDGATNPTKITVIEGIVDDSQAFYTGVAKTNMIAWGVVLILTIAEYGEMDSYELRNGLGSSPHFIEDSAGSGLADGWNAVGTASTATPIAPVLIGNKCQRIQASATGAGIRSDAVTVGAGNSNIAKVYVNIDDLASGRSISVELVDGAHTVIQTKAISPEDTSQAYQTIVSQDGTTWYEFRLSGTNVAADVKLQSLTQQSAFTKWYLDGAYIRTQVTAMPDGWVSSRRIKNRYDPTSSNEDRINYLDVFGIPGDAPAIIDHKLSVVSATTLGYVYAAKQRDGRYLAADMVHWSEGFSVFSGGSTILDGTRASGSYYRLTYSSASTNYLLVQIASTFDEIKKFYEYNHRVFLLCRSSLSTTTIEPSQNSGYSVHTGDKIQFDAANTWQLIDGGILIKNKTDLAKFTATGGDSIEFAITMAASGTTDIDAVYFIPVKYESFLIGYGNQNATTSSNLLILGEKKIFLDASTTKTGLIRGGLWTLDPGNHMTRYIYAFTDTSNAHSLTDTVDVILTVTPRVRHLIGTI